VDRMSPLDAAFLDAEDEDPHTSMAIASVGIFEGAAPDQGLVVDLLRGALPRIPRYRQKVRRVPFDLGRPVWVDDPHFVLDYHVRRTALPAPGTMTQLRALVSRLMAQRLDRERPLWEVWVVEGLGSGDWALLSKLHHCMVDGISGTDLMRVVLEPEEGFVTADGWNPAAEPSTARITAGALVDLAIDPLRGLNALRRNLAAPRAFLQWAANAGRGTVTLARTVWPARRSSLSGTIGQQRRYEWARAPLGDIRTVRGALGGTLNDVALTIISGAFRSLLQARGEPLDPHAVRSLVPVSVRAPGQESIYDNRVSMLLPFLPIDIEDPVVRLAEVRRRMSELKASKEAVAGQAMTALAGYGPFPLVSLGIRLGFRLPQRTIVTVTTNVPGPRHRLQLDGHPLRELFPYVPISSTVRVGIAFFSYGEELTFGITGDYDTATDIDVLSRAIENDLARLVQAAAQPQPQPSTSRRTG
jgi:WS/DGAT/MGAT family acyltransferase